MKEQTKKVKKSKIDEDGNRNSERTKKSHRDQAIINSKKYNTEQSKVKHDFIQVDRRTIVVREKGDKKPISEVLLKHLNIKKDGKEKI